MQDDYTRPSSDELLKRYVEAADIGDWHRARNVCNIAGSGPGVKICSRLDFLPHDGAMWVKLYEFAMSIVPRKAEKWRELCREVIVPE